jgi:tetratricopeptide (TPR) repeat protein/GTP-binding protein EngB required for normal cell division
MGILDRIAGTLEGLTGDANNEANAEIARAQELADAGELAAAEAALVALTQASPRFAPAYAALGRTRARRGHLDEAVTALGRAVDLDSGDAGTWYALGDALASLGRAEPALDALRRALTLSLDLGLHARIHAALGRIHARNGQWTAALRSFRKALELGGQQDTDRVVALDYGRTLAAVGEREATEWLTRAARVEGADVHVFIEAAAATADDALADKLLAEGLARAPGDRPLRAARARRMARLGRHDEAIAIAETCVAEAPGDVAALAALRETYADAGRPRDGLRIAAEEARAGSPPPLATRAALALAAADRDAVAALAAEPVAAGDVTSGELRAALRAFVDRKATPAELLQLGRIAPDAGARAFVARDAAPQPPPAGQLAGLLTWTHDLFSAAPALGSLAAAAGHAAEALDRPLLVAVMGEFNAGKSSFVNALAGEEVAPTGVTPTTATVNVLRYGPAPAARVIGHDGSARDLPAADIARVVTSLDGEAARAVRLVEIFLPVETLRRVEIVDTPGLNSIRPEHERVARDFLQEADAIVWVFGIGQAAKATEKAALELARGAGKRVVGVLNKVDRADAAEVGAVVDHVKRSLGDLVETVVPFSATRALAARRAGKPDAAMTALSAVLDERFFTQALALKRATAVSALRRLLATARAAAEAAAPAPRDFAAAHAAVVRLEQALAGALDGERVALRARILESYRRAALEVREFVRPRSWLFGEHRATPADEEFLGELLEDGITRALERTRAALRAPLAEAEIDTTPLATTIDTALDRFAAYARGVIEGGAVPDFFRNQLPRLRLEVAAIRDALARRAPDPEEALFAPLRRELAARFHAIAADIDAAAIDAEVRALVHAHGLIAPLTALAAAVQALDGAERGFAATVRTSAP